VIGNGPSLNEMDLSLLRGEYTLALNRGYLLFDRIGAPSTFLVTVNRHVVEQWGEELAAAPCTKLISWHSREFVNPAEDIIFVRSTRGPRFAALPPVQGVWEGATVTYVALQLAAYFGFDPIILIGVDHRFATQGPPHKLVTSHEDDPNHFSPDYFGPGARWQLPDLETSELAYRLAAAACARQNRTILDATVGGQLNVFPKIAFDALFASRG
jgi:hypothetical protein